MTVGSHRGISKMQTSLRRSRDSTVKATQNRTILLFRCSDAVRAAGSKILAALFHTKTTLLMHGSVKIK